jgi:thiol-disulfide isomerase/thioredoxin
MENNKNNNIINSLYKDIYGIEKGVLELNLSDFVYKKKNLYINNSYFDKKKGFIIFYAPWCKHCKKIADTLINLALSNINLFYFGSVNAENIEMGNDKLCVYANIKKFPTIKYINEDGSLEDYKHNYNYDNLIYFINMNT